MNSGLRRIFVLTQYRRLSLERHLERIWEPLLATRGGRLAPLPPAGAGAGYLGTADAVFQNLALLGRESPRDVLVLSGDHVYRMDYRPFVEFHRQRRADATIACVLVEPEETRHLGVALADADGRIRGWAEKPVLPPPLPRGEARHLASMGVYVFDGKALAHHLREDAARPGSHDFGRDVIPSMIRSARVFAYPFGGSHPEAPPYWRDIGRIDAYHAAHMDLVSPHPPVDPDDPDWPIPCAIQRRPPPRLERAGAFRPCVAASLIGAGTWVKGATVLDSVVGRDVRLAPGCEVVRSVLLDGVSVGAAARIRDAVVAAGAIIPAGREIGRSPDADASRYGAGAGEIVVVARTPDPLLTPAILVGQR